MRAIAVVACLGLFACQSENELVHLSSTETTTDGLALSEDGTQSFAAMAGTTCVLDARVGCPIADEDLPTEDEQVLDHFEGETLALSAHTLHFMDGGHWDKGADIEVPSLRQARLTRRGLLTVEDRDAECVLSHDGVEVAVDGLLCADGVEVEVDRRGALVAITTAGAFRADVSGVERISATADRVSVDPHLGQTYLAQSGKRAIEAVGDDGARRWEVELDGAVRDLVTRGDKADLLVLSEGRDGLGLVSILDGSTGKELSAHAIPSANGRIEVAGSGRVMAFISDDEVHHFEVVVGGEKGLPASKDPECSDIPTRDGGSMGLD